MFGAFLGAWSRQEIDAKQKLMEETTRKEEQADASQTHTWRYFMPEASEGACCFLNQDRSIHSFSKSGHEMLKQCF